MSDTPETDKYCGEDLWIGEPALVSSDFARKLERERNSLQDQRDFCMGEIKRLRKERDEARAEAAALLRPAEAVEAFCLAHNHANKVEEAICSLSFQLQAADEHRRLAERLAEAAMFERDQLRMRVAELQNGIVVEAAK